MRGSSPQPSTFASQSNKKRFERKWVTYVISSSECWLIFVCCCLNYEIDTMFVCPAVMKDPGQANIAFHCVVPQSWGMFPWMHVLKSSKHEQKSNNVRKESANCSYHLYIYTVCLRDRYDPYWFLNGIHRLVCVCNVDCYLTRCESVHSTRVSSFTSDILHSSELNQEPVADKHARFFLLLLEPAGLLTLQIKQLDFILFQDFYECPVS